MDPSPDNQSHRRTVLVTGAASGIGAAFARHYAADSNNRVVALDRTWPEGSKEQLGSNVECHSCDITDPSQLPLADIVTEDAPLELVIHSAGIRGLNTRIPMANGAHLAECETVDAIDGEIMLRTLNINCVGAYNAFRAVLPALRRAAHATTPKVIVIGSRMGSIARNTRSITGDGAGRGYAYRASKAALNAIVRSFAVDVPEVLWLVMHPGRVATGLVSVREEGAIEVEDSVRDMVSSIEKADREKQENGRFVDRWDQAIPW